MKINASASRPPPPVTAGALQLRIARRTKDDLCAVRRRKTQPKAPKSSYEPTHFSNAAFEDGFRGENPVSNRRQLHFITARAPDDSVSRLFTLQICDSNKPFLRHMLLVN